MRQRGLFQRERRVCRITGCSPSYDVHGSNLDVFHAWPLSDQFTWLKLGRCVRVWDSDVARRWTVANGGE